MTSKQSSNALLPFFIIVSLIITPGLVVASNSEDVRNLMVQCHDVHVHEINEVFESIRSNDLFAERHSLPPPLSMFMVGTSRSYFENVPKMIARSVSGRDAYVVDIGALDSHDEVKDALARGSRREGEHSRTLFVFDHMENVDDRDVAKLNALLRPMNRDHALMTYDSETIDFSGSLFFFLYHLPHDRSDSLGARPTKEDLKVFVGNQYSFDRNLFTPEAFVGRISNVMFFKDFANHDVDKYPCSDLFRSQDLMGNEMGGYERIYLVVVLVLGALMYVFIASSRRNKKKSSRNKSKRNRSPNSAATYDEDDSKGYPLRRSTRSRTPPSRF